MNRLVLLLLICLNLFPVSESFPVSAIGSDYKVTSPPASMKLDPFYKKYVDASGYPIISSAKVNDYALIEAAHLVDMMLKQRPDVRKAMVANGSRLTVMAYNEFTTDIPEYSQMKPKDFWDARARGLGGSKTDPICSCAEENLLGFLGDPYQAECILIHEFAHNIHLVGMVNVDATFDKRLLECYQRAMKQHLWKKSYATTDHREYFAEGVQSWFNNNRENDNEHNHVNTRKELKQYDPDLAKMCEEVFGKTELVYTKPDTRLQGHMKGYVPSKSPQFVWPKRLKTAQKLIKAGIEKRNKEQSKKAE